MNDKPMGTFRILPPKLQKTALMASKENAKSNRKNSDEALERQFKKLRMKEEIMLRKQYAKGARDVSLSTMSLLGFLWVNFDETYIKKIASSRTIQINRSPVMILSL